ncbi:MAG: hypothetical protein AAB263_08325, partial [Planctomycetota bacterium]
MTHHGGSRRVWLSVTVVLVSAVVINVCVLSGWPGHPSDGVHMQAGALKASQGTSAVLANQEPALSAGLPSFWTISIRVKPATDGDQVVVVSPYLSERLPDDIHAVRYSWHMEPAFEAVFGVRTHAVSDVVVGGMGEDKNPQVRYWENERPADLRKLDEQQPLEHWRDSRHRIGPVLRIPANAVDHADAFYRLYSTLELRNDRGEPSRLEFVEIVRFLPNAAVEAVLPDGMHDPTGLSSDTETEKTLRGWLAFDDWYVQCIAIIRLKALGREVPSVALNRFFRLAALTGDRPLVRRALDALRATEGTAGAEKLLTVGCGWALPWAIRFNSSGTEAWMESRLEYLFGHPVDTDEHETLWYQKKAMLAHYLALAGVRAVPVLSHLAMTCTDAGDFDILLEAICDISAKESMNLASRRPPSTSFPSNEGVKWLLRSGQDHDVVLACRWLELYSGKNISSDLTTPVPEAAIPLLVGKLANKEFHARENAIRILAGVRSVLATQACLTALADQQLGAVTATALATAKRVDLVSHACRLAQSLNQTGGKFSHLWPLILLAPTVDIHQLVFDTYFGDASFEHREQFLGFLRHHAELSAAAALKLFQMGKPTTRAADLLLELEDACAVPILLERLAHHPPRPRSPEEIGHHRNSEKPDPMALKLEEMNYLAAFVPQEKLAVIAHHFLAFHLDSTSWYAFLDKSTTWVNHGNVLGSSSALARIKKYMAAIQEFVRNRPCPSGGGPGPAPVPSPLNILRLRDFSPAAVLPLLVSENDNVRALGATLLGGTPRSGRVWPEAEVPILERLLSDRSEMVQAAAFQTLQNHCQEKLWYWEQLLAGRPGGPARSAVMTNTNSWTGTNAERNAIHMRMLRRLAEGDSLGLAALAFESADDADAISRALASPAMTPILARDIVARLNDRRSDATFVIIRRALQSQLRDEIRSAIIWNLGCFAEARPLPGSGVRSASPEAGQAICEALVSNTPVIREAALGALRQVSVPESTTLLTTLLSNPGRHGTQEIALALLRQPPDERVIAPLENLLRTQYGHNTIKRYELAAYIAVAGERAFPLMRELELKLRTTTDFFARQEYGYLMEQLIRMKEPQTVAVQTEWFVAIGRKVYRSEEWPMSEALRKGIGTAMVALMDKSTGDSKADVAGELCRYDHEAGIQALIGLMKDADGYIAKRAYWNLGNILG